MNINSKNDWLLARGVERRVVDPHATAQSMTRPDPPVGCRYSTDLEYAEGADSLVCNKHTAGTMTAIDPDPREAATQRVVDSLNRAVKESHPVPSVLEVKPEAGDANRKDTNKSRGYWLIPQAPLAELARLYATGAAKYSPRGWEAGMEYSRIIDAMDRHMAKYLAGERYDAVDGQHHMAAVAWGAFAIMEYERTHPEFNDINPTKD